MRGEGDSIGARVTVVASGVPPGLGEPVFDRLDADIAHALMSINAVKAVELGAGVRAAAQRGSEHRDELTPDGLRSNNAGGVLGGISSGQDVVAHLTLKPTSSIQVPGRTIDTAGNAVEIVTTGRHDPCVGLRATPIAEAMLAIVLMDHYLRQRAQNADVKSPPRTSAHAVHDLSRAASAPIARKCARRHGSGRAHGRVPHPAAATEAAKRDTVYVGRIREDLAPDRGLNLWIVADNVRKGGLPDSVQIAKALARAAYLSYIAAGSGGGSQRMAHPFVFTSIFTQ